MKEITDTNYHCNYDNIGRPKLCFTDKICNELMNIEYWNVEKLCNFQNIESADFHNGNQNNCNSNNFYKIKDSCNRTNSNFYIITLNLKQKITLDLKIK